MGCTILRLNRRVNGNCRVSELNALGQLFGRASYTGNNKSARTVLGGVALDRFGKLGNVLGGEGVVFAVGTARPQAGRQQRDESDNTVSRDAGSS